MKESSGKSQTCRASSGGAADQKRDVGRRNCNCEFQVWKAMNLNGKVAIVTGGTKGIGRGIAEALVLNGAQICLSARHRDEIDRAVETLQALGECRVIGAVCDVR